MPIGMRSKRPIRTTAASNIDTAAVAVAVAAAAAAADGTMDATTE